MSGSRPRFLKIAFTLSVAIALATASVALATSAGAVSVGPIKGATYSGVVHDSTVTVKVANNGKTASASMRAVPGYCQGGSGPETAHFKPGAIKKDAFKETISFTAEGSSKIFATAVIQGSFLGKDFDGTEKSTFKASPTCNGQESFEAVTSK